jgi:hypothetical protein
VDYVLGVIDTTIAGVRGGAAAARLTDLAAHGIRLRRGFDAGRRRWRLARFIALTGNLDSVRTLYSTYGAVTPADVQRAATQYLTTRRTVACSGAAVTSRLRRLCHHGGALCACRH